MIFLETVFDATDEWDVLIRGFMDVSLWGVLGELFPVGTPSAVVEVLFKQFLATWYVGIDEHPSPAPYVAQVLLLLEQPIARQK